jgi:voltage-gated potassium channel
VDDRVVKSVANDDAGEGEPKRARPQLEWTMFILALLMVPLVVIQESSNDAEVLLWTERLNALIWAAFVVEYLYLFVLADNKRRFVRGHWFDLLIIVVTPPIALLPTELDALRALRVLRVIRAIAAIGRANHVLRRFLRRDSLPYIVALSLFVVLLGGLTIHALEPDTADTVGDGVWWAAATLSTVGYGDIAPKTVMGRVLAVAIMVVGISTFAVLTAGIASLFVRDERREVNPELAAIHGELQAIRETLATLSGTAPTGVARSEDRSGQSAPGATPMDASLPRG